MTDLKLEHKGKETRIILSGYHEIVLFIPETSNNRTCIVVEKREVKEDE